mgnify:CR=1 FL=1
MLNIQHFKVNFIEENCYVVSDETREAVIIDCGAFFPEEKAAICSYMAENKLVLRHLLCTHGHFDHIGAVDAVCEKYGVPVYIHEADAPKLTDPEANTGCRFGHPVTVRTQPRLLHDDEELNLAGIGLKVLHTPGHSKGSVCYLLEEGQGILTGDTLFKGGYGRYDFADGSFHELKESLRTLFHLTPQMTAWPGHGEATVAGRDREEQA